jgi:hypothetical protein
VPNRDLDIGIMRRMLPPETVEFDKEEDDLVL